MKPYLFALFAAAYILAAQTPQPATPATPAPLPPSLTLRPAPVSPDSVVAEVDGQKLTAAEVKKMLSGLPPQLQQGVAKDPKGIIQYLFTLRHLAAEGEKEKLDQQSPTKEQIEFSRSQVLAQADIEHQSSQFKIDDAEQQKFYQDHKSDFEQAKIKVIYISFGPPGGAKDKPTRSEAEASSKADNLVKQLRGGADFGKLAKENSDDPVSAARDGDYSAPIHRTDRITESVKTTIFALKPGDVSDPIKQSTGFYIFKLVDKSVQPYEEVKPRILNEMKQARLKTMLDGIQKRYEVKVDNEAFFANPNALK
ncbi:MAG TPA: peptidylprolyl isomerase [Bryobacteraceae bacterium]|nr:peptidylprolyl isomerase [Bryobacteraceae bacterium]